MANRALKTFRLPPPRGVDVTRNKLGMDPAWSPYSINSDFDKGTIRKRRGMRKLHRYCIPPVGLHHPEGTNASADAGPYVYIHNKGDWTFGTSWTIEFCIRVETMGAYNGGYVFGLGDHSAGGDTFDFHVSTVTNAATYSLSWSFDHASGGGTTAGSFSNLNVDQWYHIALVRTGANTYEEYLDGVSVGSGATASANANVSSGSNPLVIGGKYDASQSGVKYTIVEFSMSEVRIWNEVRSEAALGIWDTLDLSEYDESDWQNLEGYWKLNDGDGRIAKDSSVYRNHGFFNKCSGIYVPSPFFGESEEFALLLDGYDDYATIPYHAAYEPIDDTSVYWTVEIAFMPYHVFSGTANVIIEMKGGATGIAFTLHTAGADDDYLGGFYDSAVTWDVVDSGVRAEPYVPVFLSLVRDYDELRIYVNGVLCATNDTLNGANAGPDSDADIRIGCRSAKSLESCGVFDEIRLWTYARSAEAIADNWNRRLPDELAPGLVGYFRLNGEGSLVDASATGNDGVIYPTSENVPTWGEGAIKPRFPSAVYGIASLDTELSGSDLRQDQGLSRLPTKRRLVFAAGAGLYELVGDEFRLVGKGFRAKEPIDTTAINRLLILCNGLDYPQKYDGEREMAKLGYDTPAQPSGAAGAAGNPNGDYYGVIVYKNSKTNAVSLQSPVSAQVSVSNEKITWTVALSTQPGVDQILVYRTIAGGAATGLFYLAVTADNTSTTITDDVADASLDTATIPDLYTGAPQPMSCCAEYKGMLVLAGRFAAPHTVYISDVNEPEHMYSLDTIVAGANAGGRITALEVLHDDCIVGKERAIWRINGAGPPTTSTGGMAARIISSGHGMVGPRACCVFNPGSADHLAFIDVDGVWGYAQGAFVKLSTPFDAYFNGVLSRLNPSKLRHNIIANNRRKGELWVSLHLGDPEIDLGDLIAKFDFDQDPSLASGVNVIRDQTGNSRHLSSQGSMTASDLISDGGVYGDAIEFDGSDDCFTMQSESLINLRTFSVGVWVYPTASGGYICHYSNTDDSRYWYIKIEEGFTLYDGTSTFQRAFGVAVDGWTHIACTFDGDKMRVYKNGVLYSSVDAEAVAYGLDNDNKFHIGSNVDEDSTFFEGKMGEMYISRDAWPAETVRLLYERGLKAQFGQEPIAREQKTLIINYRTGQNRIIDRGFTALAEVETDDGKGMFVGADDRGFVYELDVGNADGVIEGAVSGTVASRLQDRLVTSSGFYDGGDGLKGVEVWVKDTAGNIQKRVVRTSEPTNVYVTEKWSPKIDLNDEFWIGCIDFDHHVAVLDFGNVRNEKAVKHLNIVQEKQSEEDKDVDVYSKCDMAADWAEQAQGPDAGGIHTDEFHYLLPISNVRSKVAQFRFRQYQPNVPVEMNAVEAEWEDSGARS